jgi:methylglyoxal synthase
LVIDGLAGVTAIDCNVAAVTVSKVEPLIDDDVAVIVEVPTPAAVARPAALIVAVVVVPDDHVTVLVRFCVVPSLNVPVAVNCCVAPLAIEGFAGVTAIDCSVAAVTVSKVEPLIEDDVAVIVEVPTPAPVARPAALIVAVVVVTDDHVTVLVRFCVVPSLNVPVAVNCCVAPLAIEGFAGVTAIDCNVAAVTVSKVEPLIEEDVAVIVEVPTPAPLARPAALIVAVVVVPEDHVTVLVRFCVVPSLNVPVAVNCCVAPLAIDGFAGATAIDCNVAAVTVSKVEPEIDDDVAVIVEFPTPTPVARPDALIVAVVVVPEDHVTVLVRFCVVPSLNVPVAVNCCVAPLVIDGLAGVTAIDCSVAAFTVSKVEPLSDDDVAVIVELPTPAPVARPAALIVAMVVVPEVQVTLDVTFCVVPSLNVPVAVNC